LASLAPPFSFEFSIAYAAIAGKRGCADSLAAKYGSWDSRAIRRLGGEIAAPERESGKGRA
jgi:hypothetical protein